MRHGTARPGFTLVEALLVTVILGIVLGIVAPSFRGLSNDLENSVAETSGFLRQARSKAMTTTSAYRVIFESETQLRVEHARRCSETTWEPDGRLQLHLRERTQFKTTYSSGDVVLCFSSRGVADANPTLLVADHKGDATEIEVFLGGGVRATRLAGGIP